MQVLAAREYLKGKATADTAMQVCFFLEYPLEYPCEYPCEYP